MNLRPVWLALLPASLALGCGGADPTPPPPPPPPPAPVVSVSVSLAAADLGIGQVTQATATLRGSVNQVLTGRSVSWASSAPGIASVAGSGQVTAVAAGSAEIVATSEGVSGSAAVRVFGGDPNLALANLLLTQVVQRSDGTVPLVLGGNPVLFNLFGTLDRPYPPGSPVPLVRIEIYSGSTLVLQDERALTGSASAQLDPGVPLHQVVFPPSVVQPGMAVRARINPTGVLPDANHADDVWPANGVPRPVAVQAVPPLPLHFLPIVLTVGGSAGSVTPSELPEYLFATRQMHPVSSIVADIGPGFTSDVDFGGGLEPAWLSILQQVDLARVLEGSSSYYMGALRPPPGVSFVQFGGYSYIPSNPAGSGPNTRTSVVVGVGWFNRARQTTELVAHELSHAMGRRHAPCGGAASPDPGYPYPLAAIGVYGYDLYSWSLGQNSLPTQLPPSTADLMSYCTPPWISDYNYLGLLAARGGAVATATTGSGSCPCLIVWGSIRDGAIRLEPSFMAPPPARPTAAAAGPYTLRGLDGSGNPEFALSFAAAEIDHAPGVRQFTLAVPLSDLERQSLARIEVTGQGSPAEQLMAPAAQQAAAPLVQRTGADRLTVRWDRLRSPLLVVRDPETGRVLAVGRSGALLLTTSRDRLDFILAGVR